MTTSRLSGRGLGKHITSIRYRKMLADYYAPPPKVLFAHQDQQLTAGSETPRLLVGHHDLRAAMTKVVHDAGEYLASWVPLTRPTPGCCSRRRWPNA